MLPSMSELVCRQFILLLCARTGWHVVYVEFVDFIGGVDGWPAHEGQQHVYSGKLLVCRVLLREGCLVVGCRKMVGSELIFN